VSVYPAADHAAHARMPQPVCRSQRRGFYMPAIVGFVNVVSIGSGGVVQFGDAVQLSPSSVSKTYAGSGSFLTGSLANANNAVSSTNTIDPDVQDSTNNELATGVNTL